jgi:hypothetical protein
MNSRKAKVGKDIEIITKGDNILRKKISESSKLANAMKKKKKKKKNHLIVWL